MKINSASILFIILSVLVLHSCNTYYMSRTTSLESVDSLSKTSRIFILRSGSQSWLINHLVITPDKTAANCQLDLVPSDHMHHLSNTHRSHFQYNKSSLNERAVTNEVHLFTAPDTSAKPGPYKLSLGSINRIEILEHDKKRTTISHVRGAIAITAGTAAVALIIAAALKSSCPFISAWDGNSFSLQGEIYGGSIYPQLERKDFLGLKMAPDSAKELHLRISNELKERQYTDYVRLWEITHPAGSRVLVDEWGNLRSIQKAQAPVSALINNETDVLPLLKQAGDGLICEMNDTSIQTGNNHVLLRFKRPAGTEKGKLLLTMKNTYFLDLLYAELAKGFGTYYAAYMKSQQKKTREQLLQWVKEQQIPLEIAVKNREGWQTLKALSTVGPLAFRETAIEIPLSETEGEEIELRLSCGFHFWEIDFAGMDYSTTSDYQINILEPYAATDEKGDDVLPLLAKEDRIYLDQPQIGNAASIRFRSSGLYHPGSEKTYILETKGYYEHLREFTNPPDKQFLENFKRPGTFPLFGLQLFKKIQREKLLIASSN